MDIKRIRGAIELMEKTGTDDSQYVLVPLKDLRQLADSWERDQATQDLFRRILHAIEEKDHAEDKDCGKESKNGKHSEEKGPEICSERSKNRRNENGSH